MTASRIVLDGIVPVLTQTPPTTERDSTTATRFFIFEAATAARCPEGPEPMTTRSYLAALIRVSPGIDSRAEVYQPARRRIPAQPQRNGREWRCGSREMPFRLRLSQPAAGFINAGDNLVLTP